MRNVYIIIVLVTMAGMPCNVRGDECPACKCECATAARGSYTGVRIYKNQRGSFEYKPFWKREIRYMEDNLGFGTTVGTNLKDYLRVEYETLYMGSQYSTRGTDFEYNIWSNLLNAYVLYNFEDALSPYVGLGLGLTGIWGDVDSHLSSTFDLSYQALAGVLFHVNRRIDIDVGFKYVHFGTVDHSHATTRVNAAQFYVGGAYKFSL